MGTGENKDGKMEKRNRDWKCATGRNERCRTNRTLYSHNDLGILLVRHLVFPIDFWELYNPKSAHCSLSWAMHGKSRCAPSFVNASSGSGPLFTATVKHPAATPARTPKGAFSTTMPWYGLRFPAFFNPIR